MSALRYVGILIGAIAVLMLSHSIGGNVSNKPAFPDKPWWHDAIRLVAVAEPQPSPRPEAVDVVHGAPNVQRGSVSLELLDLLPAEFGIMGPAHFSARGENVSAGKDIGVIDFKNLLPVIGVDRRIDYPSDALCGKIAGVGNLDPGDRSNVEVFYPESVNGNVGAFNNRKGALGDTSSPLGNPYRLIHVAGVAAQLNSLPDADSGNGYGDEHEPFRECSQLCRVNRKLARILGEPPFVSAALFLIVAGGLAHRGFSLYYRGRRFAGTVLVSAGVALALSDGFATIGEGPLGWIVWVGS